MQTLFEARPVAKPAFGTFGGYSTEAAEPVTEDKNKWLRVIALLLFAAILGGAYIYSQQPEKHLHVVRCTTQGCTDTDFGRIQ